MITRVLDAAGDVLHDCDAAGCGVSWDGYAIAPQTFEQTDPQTGATTTQTVKQGDPMPGRTDPDPQAWAISADGKTATAKQ